MFTLIIEDKSGAIADEYTFEEGEFVIGRSRSTDIVLPSDNVSRRHARLFTKDGRCWVEDLNSANGIWLNGNRVSGLAEVPRSAQIRIGDFFLHIEGASFSRPLAMSAFARLVPADPDLQGPPMQVTRAVTLLGRGKDCGLVINDASVSRIHAKISRDADGTIRLEDLKSSNGTFVNGRRIEKETLRHADRVRFGMLEYRVDLGEEAFEDATSEEREPPNYEELAAAAPAPPVDRVRIFLLATLAVLIVVLIAIVIVWFTRGRGRSSEPRDTPATPAAAAPAAQTAPPLVEPGEDAAALLKSASDAIEQRHWDDADRLFQRARKADPIATKPIEGLNRVRAEKAAAAHYDAARAAFAKKAYDQAIREYKQVAKDSVYRIEADGQLQSIARLLELEGDRACAAKDEPACIRAYEQSIETGAASPDVETKLRNTKAADGKKKKKGR